MADEQIPMEQEPSKAEPPETGAGYDDADEARAGQPASSRNAPLTLPRSDAPVCPMRPGQVGGEGGDGGAEQDELTDGSDPNLPGQHRRPRAAPGPLCARQGEVRRTGHRSLPPATLPTPSAPRAHPTSRAHRRPAPRPERAPPSRVCRPRVAASPTRARSLPAASRPLGRHHAYHP